MLRLLSFVAFAALLLLVVCGAGSNKTQSHTAHLDRIELPPAVPSTTALESTTDLSATAASSILRV
jgi:hypothetical protein